MAKCDVVVRCDSAEELEMVLRYLAWKGHNEADGTLVVDRNKLVATAINEKEIDTFYVNRKMFEELPEPPVPPG